MFVTAVVFYADTPITGCRGDDFHKVFQFRTNAPFPSSAYLMMTVLASDLFLFAPSSALDEKRTSMTLMTSSSDIGASDAQDACVSTLHTTAESH